ncbi:DNA polymerase III subunit delta [Dielma fastidiosa]|uniref:DNA polymerase III subunit delta n=1 Tax=Dielma fastidiosa TaxID=1034346 RepID=UPI000E529C56|nr:DNA polymerase III subunit delta [Dielma fastidiosa]RHN02768.1 DNA polymerase III subunit delta [Dielma fastidiosa]
MNYLIYSEDRGRIQKEIQKIVKDNMSNDVKPDTITYNMATTSLEEILADAQTIPFFTEHKIIVAQNCSFLSAANEGSQNTESLEAYLDHPMLTTTLILSGNFEKVDKRKKIVKTIQKTCRVISCSTLDEQGKRAQVIQTLKASQLKLSDEELNHLVSLLPCDSAIIENELAKLIAYPETLNMRVIDLLITRQIEDDVFALADAIMKGREKQVFKIWNDLNALNKEPIFMISVLASQFRFYYQVKTLLVSGLNENDITQELKAHPYRVKLSVKAVGAVSCDQLLKVLAMLADTDQKIKSGLLDKQLGFELFLIHCKGVFA